ncbi:MAG: O-methyltransferase [Bacteroidales bacterium]|nr:O-methyltransferase [Bacteroidales bacterium]
MLKIDRALEEYILAHCEPEEEVLAALYRETQVRIYHPRMASGHMQGMILSMLVKMIQPQRILEIGTYTGYSSISMARALPPGGELHTIEVNDELEDFIRQYVEKAGVSSLIQLHIGDALDILPTLQGPFNFVFIDGNKAQYIDYYELALPLVPKGGFIFADNVLWDGKVLKPNLRDNDHFTHGILQFNEHIKQDNRVEKVIFPFRDGIFVLRKK